MGNYGYRQAIVIGASSGIGAALAARLAADGCMVAIVARRLDRLEALASQHPGKMLCFEHDVLHGDEVPQLFQKITGVLGGLDLIVYAAGIMPDVAWHEYDFEKDNQTIQTNVIGAIAWLNQASIRFEATKRGTIIGIGSVAGDRGRGGRPVYGASKAALTTYLEALRNRLARHGVTVVTVKPGPVRTEMTSHLGQKGMMSADEAARRILEVSRSSGEKYLKTAHRIVFAIIRLIPSWIFRQLKI